MSLPEVPSWSVLAGISAWLISLVLWATGDIRASFSVFLGTLLCAAIALAVIVGHTFQGKGLLRGARASVLLVLAFLVPVIFDPHTSGVVDLPKYTVVVIGALILGALWLIELVHERRFPSRNGLQWLVIAVVLWTIISALSGVDLHVALLGNYGSYDGLYSTLAFALIMLCAADAFDVEDIGRIVSAFAFVAGSVVVVYGLIQFHDSFGGGPTWDFNHWMTASFSHDIFATLGNPNHLGGYLAMVFPVALVAALRAKQRWSKFVIGLFGFIVLVEILRTAARGAWVAVIVSMIVFGLMFLPEIRRRPAISVGAGAGVLVVVALGMVVIGRKLLHEPLSQLFRSGGTSPVEQRFQIWSAAVHMAVHHPIVGIGPDTFGLVYPQYESASWVKGLGSNYLVNGAHDLFVNLLADQGFVGLAIFLVLLLAAGLRVVGSWRRLRSAEHATDVMSEHSVVARDRRFLLAALSASLVAYIVQSAFDVQQIALSFGFWLELGALGLLTTASGVPDTLLPRSILAVDDGSERVGPSARRRASGHGRRAAPRLTAVVALVATVAVVLLALGADRPYRADHASWAATANPGSASSTNASGSSAGVDVNPAYLIAMQTAMNLNPWEHLYPANAGQTLLSAASRPASTAVIVADVSEAEALYAKASSDQPLSGADAYGEAVAYANLAHLQPAQRAFDLRAGIHAIHRALRDNPLDPTYRAFLGQLLTAQRAKK